MNKVFELCEQLTPLEREWLTGSLVSNRAVQSAIFGDGHPHRLAIEYAGLDRLDLLDLLYVCGLHGIRSVA